MSRILDNVSATPEYHGSRVERLPVKDLGNYHAVEISRTVMASPVTAYTAALGKRAALTALLKYSDDFSQAVWTKTNATGTSGATTDPEGGTSCSKLAESNATGAHSASQATVVAAGLLGFGVIMKAAERSNVRLRINNGTDGDIGLAVFNLSTGVVVSGTGTIKPLRNGWWWCYVTATPTVSNSSCIVDLSSDGATFSYLGTTGSGIYLFHATAYLCATLGSAFYAGAPTMGPALYTAAATRTVSTPAVDPDDPIAFLMDETEPQPSAAEYGVAIWTRRFNHVPRQTSVPNSQFITKPALSGTFPQIFGNSIVFQPDPNAEVWEFFNRTTITGDTGPVTTFYPTSGTYTLSFAGSTTGAIGFDGSAAQVQTALNAITPISDRGGVLVVGAYNTAGGFTITFNAYTAATLSTVGLAVNYGSIVSSVVTEQSGFRHNVQIVALSDSGPVTLNGSLTPATANPITQTGFSPLFGFYIGNQYSAATGGVTGGTFTITTRGQTTGAITWDPAWSAEATFTPSSTTAAAIAVAAALNALTNVQAIGSYTVTHYKSNISYGGIYPDFFLCTLTQPAILSGNYTVTLFGATTAAIPFNSDITAIQAAINLLAGVISRGGSVVTGAGYNGRNIVFQIQFPNNQAITVNNSLGPAGSLASVSAGSLGQVQTLTFTSAAAIRTITADAHGIVDSSDIFLQADGTIYRGASIPTFEVIDPNTINITVTPGSVWATVAAVQFVGKESSTYTAGVKLTRIKRVTDFYLPGITPDVATVDDIPLPTWEGDDTSLVEAILAASTSINFEVGDLERWRADIVARTLTTLNAATL